MSTAIARRGSKVQSTALAQTEEASRELAPSAGAAAQQHEIQSAIIVARQLPRSEDRCFASLVKSCGRLTFAESACYSFPRGGAAVEGPSVQLAREGARIWGNIRYGVEIVSDDEEERHIRGWAWDLETNTKVTQDDSFKKLVYRKNGGWVKPDERDLRELTNRRGSIAERNCLLKLLPPDLVESAIQECKTTIKKGVSQNIDEHRKSLIKAFAALQVTVDDLEEYLGHPLSKCTADEIATLRTVYKSILDGNSKWADYVQKEPKPASGPVSANDLENPANATAADQDDAPFADPPAELEGYRIQVKEVFDELDAVAAIEIKLEELVGLAKSPAESDIVQQLASEALARVRGGRGQKSNQKSLVE